MLERLRFKYYIRDQTTDPAEVEVHHSSSNRYLAQLNSSSAIPNKKDHRIGNTPTKGYRHPFRPRRFPIKYVPFQKSLLSFRFLSPRHQREGNQPNTQASCRQRVRGLVKGVKPVGRRPTSFHLHFSSQIPYARSCPEPTTIASSIPSCHEHLAAFTSPPNWKAGDTNFHRRWKRDQQPQSFQS